MNVKTKSLRSRLSKFEGFDEGYDRRSKIIRLGELLRKLRTDEIGLSQTDAAKLIDMPQPELSRIENGHGEQGPSYVTVTQIIEVYTEYLREKGATVKLSLEISMSDQKSEYSFTTRDDVITGMIKG